MEMVNQTRESLLKLTATELSSRIKSGQTTVREALEAVFSQIDLREEALHCYITLDREGALKRGEEVQRRIDAGELSGPLAGVPIAIKDNICTGGLKTTCGSKMLENFIPTYDSEVVRRLQKAGAIIIGKTNMDEFAMGSTTETSAFGVTENPWNPCCVAGGSSGGSAAAVAAGECFVALGSDTGGSIRQPASHCGVVGLKPTYGRVSRYGLVAYASSMDQIGPLGKSVEDCAAIMEVISGADEKDSTSVPNEDTDFLSALKEDVRGIKIGIPRDCFGEGLEGEIKEKVLAAADLLKEKGAVIEWFDLSMLKYAVPTYYTIAMAQASSNLERYDGVKYGYRADGTDELHAMYKQTRAEGFGEEVKRRIMLGAFVLSAGHYDEYYLKALKVNRKIKEAFDGAFEKYDLLLTPVAPTAAPKKGQSLADPLKMYLTDIYTVSANLIGIPAISLPCGRNEEGLPIGFQLMGNYFCEKKLLQVAYAYEQLGKEGE